MASNKTIRITTSKLGLTMGIIWGVNLLLLSLFVMFFGYGGAIIALLASLYSGYSATLVGGILGLVLGFLHGYILGVISDIVLKFVMK